MTTRFPKKLGDIPEEGMEASRELEFPASVLEDEGRNHVTAEVIDRAVEDVFQQYNVDPATQDVMRKLMTTDANVGVAQAYYHGVASTGLQRARKEEKRNEVKIPYVLSEHQMALLSKYAPEYTLSFRSVENHDHSPAAACRLIDRSLVASRVPPGCKVVDAGSAVMVHVASGELGVSVHGCCPMVDPKDPGRQVFNRLRARRLVASSESEQVRRSARAYLDEDLSAVCGKTLQTCTVQARVITSVHVYDIPMGEWPKAMESHGAELVEGCLLFPREVFSATTGSMETAGARYEVDAEAGVFRMGFSDSPAWWYEHRLVDYLKYGVDQVILGEEYNYSYKVVERRGDTLFFRILRVGKAATPDQRQVYKLPGVPMVKVDGYALVKGRHKLSRAPRKTYVWPLPLWEEMLTHATLMVERGVLDHERLFNYYRTVAPRNTINTVLVSGGYTVEIDELLPLVVHVALCATAGVLKSQAELRAVIGQDLKGRARLDEWTLYKGLAAFGSALAAAGWAVCTPLSMFMQMVDDAARAVVVSQLVSWEPVCVVQDVNAKLVLSHLGREVADITVEDGFLSAVDAVLPLDPLVAAEHDPGLAGFLLETCGSLFPRPVLERLETVVAKTEDSSTVAAGVAVVAREESDVELKRKDAVREAIVEVEMEELKVSAWCASAYAELMVGASPNVGRIKSRSEEFMNPDFWRVENGVIGRSVLGLEPSDFMHSAVFTPEVDPGGSRLRPVFQEDFDGESKGERVRRVYHKLADAGYSGWVMTNDAVVVYNGREIRATLDQALSRPMNFRLVLKQGPPGCGKTTAIVKGAKISDVISCPVRKSSRETADRLVSEKPEFAAVVASRVRTLDSYLVNYGASARVKGLAAPRLMADEGFMARAGKWYAAAALLGVSELCAFGDEMQIPHVPRAECPKLHVRIEPDEVDSSYLTYRCPPTAVACWGGVYSWKVRSASKKKGEVKMVVSSSGMRIPFGCVMMGMYQADKKVLRQMYANCGTKVQIMTVHESQGNTYEHVWLHRFDVRKRTDNFSLYDKPAYCLVAMSRHTESFVYVAPSLGDQVEKWIEVGKDPRRVAAAGDVESAGMEKEFY